MADKVKQGRICKELADPNFIRLGHILKPFQNMKVLRVESRAAATLDNIVGAV
jgi:hypothetical protein